MSDLVDENAFGVLIAYFDIENDEYSLDSDDFVDRTVGFRTVIVDALPELPVGLGAAALDMGHAVYVEFAEPDEPWDPLPWVRALQTALGEREFPSVLAVTYGSRWVPETPDELDDRQWWVGSVSMLRASRVSEPFRRALYVDTAAQPDEESETSWGPGLYIDTEALEALGRRLKNAPTPLRSGGATYYRINRGA